MSESARPRETAQRVPARARTRPASAAHSQQSTGTRRVQVSVADAAVRAEVTRAAAAANCVVAEHSLGGVSEVDWRSDAIQVLDRDSAIQAAGAGLGRHRSAIIVGAGDDQELLRPAIELGAQAVIALPRQSPRLVELLGAQLHESGTDGQLIAVVGACGGAGVSVFSAALALTAPDHHPGRTLLLDCDPAAGGLDIMLGLEERPGLRWPEVSPGAGRVSADVLHDALVPVKPRLSLLTCAQAQAHLDVNDVRVVLSAGRGDGGLVIADLPRTANSVQQEVLAAAQHVLVVIPAHMRALVAAKATLAGLSQYTAEIGLVVRGPAPGGLTPRDAQRLLGYPVVSTVRALAGLDRQIECAGLRVTRRTPLWRAASAALQACVHTGPGARA